jgi:hypothetical protein
MSRITLTVDQLVLRGFEPGERNALVEALRGELARVLANPATRAKWARPHRTPVLRLGALPLESGAAGARRFGGGVARAIGKGLKP